MAQETQPGALYQRRRVGWERDGKEFQKGGDICVPMADSCWGLRENKFCRAVQFSRSVVSDSLWPHEPQHARPPCPSPTPGVHPNPCPLCRWCHPTISSSRPLLLPSIFPSIRVFQMSWFLVSGGQSIGVSASASVLPMNIQDWSPLEWTDWISLQSKGLSRVFSNTTVQRHRFFGAQLSL